MLREVAKHKTVEEIHSCEIDEVTRGWGGGGQIRGETRGERW